MTKISRDANAESIPLADFARRAGISLRTVFRMIEHGEVRSISFRRRRFIPATELARLNSATSAYPYVKAKSKKSSGRR